MEEEKNEKFSTTIELGGKIRELRLGFQELSRIESTLGIDSYLKLPQRIVDRTLDLKGYLKILQISLSNDSPGLTMNDISTMIDEEEIEPIEIQAIIGELIGNSFVRQNEKMKKKKKKSL